ncbi:glutamate 5-kinase [Paramagnetospirillum magneticum]|uniref:Glutamate 5-kinase n=1 Tax=Paramagnetospirillum magneticum (strain ATCC 700264 / AMB-1) TaxID=342108 RepID=PROB_PARM1|nr:glutamate 5-kinase [Paramagnetospirillum magneticum]Q2VZU1.1 RecName: Full=Glutamate 5-kinase; AltName: Full=Gamma-glutamyl kinase; Short=GK [Paramagnetospirillum magneticum AMB-1]BAE52884.1 Glutamate 5-kinase [Paramagnetospirillum magneticum AMB-1]
MSPLAAAKRLIVKIGSSLLVDDSTGQVRRGWLETLAADIAACKARGQEVIVVSSGAVAVGRRKLGLVPPLKLEEKQAAAATGQIRLAHAWQDALAHHQITVAQVLLTLDDSENRRRYLNARSTLETLLKLGAVPVINENDTVATAEIRVGDNDRLAARVAQMVSADALVLFSDIDGLYTADPRKDPDARFIPEVHELTPEIEAMAGDPGSAYGSGGMVTKLVAARICLSAGCRMAITRGEPMHPLKTIEDGGRCTWFLPNSEPRTARKQWIFGSMKPTGTLVLDAGAARALAQGRSLLPAGITEVSGAFERGDCVLVKDGSGKVLGRGLVAYSADDSRAIMGRKSGEIEAILGFRGRDELIHRDDLVMEG